MKKTEQVGFAESPQHNTNYSYEMKREREKEEEKRVFSY
jgi:hypothetical protein